MFYTIFCAEVSVYMFIIQNPKEGPGYKKHDISSNHYSTYILSQDWKLKKKPWSHYGRLNVLLERSTLHQSLKPTNHIILKFIQLTSIYPTWIHELDANDTDKYVEKLWNRKKKNSSKVSNIINKIYSVATFGTNFWLLCDIQLKSYIDL